MRVPRILYHTPEVLLTVNRDDQTHTLEFAKQILPDFVELDTKDWGMFTGVTDKAILRRRDTDPAAYTIAGIFGRQDGIDVVSIAGAHVVLQGVDIRAGSLRRPINAANRALFGGLIVRSNIVVSPSV